MPLIDLQRRAVTVGRIRIGVKMPTANGKTRPAKLSVFRFTSRDETAIRAVADLYGGEVRQWTDAPTDDQWEVITTTRELPVAVPPGPQAVSQWYELWSGGGCQRRCDGAVEQISGNACPCGPDVEKRLCKPTTRVSIILPDIPGLGVWLLQSLGWNAAHELGATAETLGMVRAAGVIVPAVLRLEQRQSVQGGQTRNFVVPVLALRQTMRELSSIQAGTVALPDAPANVRAITATASGAPPAPPAPVAPVSAPPSPPSGGPQCAQDVVPLVMACTDGKFLAKVARSARGRGWMSDFVESKYAPADGELIELDEVFIARQAELEDVAE